MILRRLTEHVRAQNWVAVALDFLIVVIGVFVGLQVSNWNEARHERLREDHYLHRLDKEFDVIRERLIDGTQVFESSVRSIDLLLAARRSYSQSSGEPIPDDEVLVAALNNLTSGRVPAAAPAAFKEMVARGALETLTSDDLRHALFAYDEFADVARDGWRTLRDEHRPAANALWATMDVSPPDNLDRDSEFVLIGFSREEFLSDPEIQGHLNVILRAQVNQYVLVQRQLELAEEIETLIAQELSS